MEIRLPSLLNVFSFITKIADKFTLYLTQCKHNFMFLLCLGACPEITNDLSRLSKKKSLGQTQYSLANYVAAGKEIKKKLRSGTGTHFVF